jgi:two-component system sensor histidine kinase DegS
MAAGRKETSELVRLYACALEKHLLHGGEVDLHAGYEIGRRALREGLGVLDMISIHYQAMQGVLGQITLAQLRPKTIQKAAAFLIEAMSPFEMTQRAFAEANAALRQLNEALENEAKRIAHALHDEAGQLLAAVYIALDETLRESPPHIQTRLESVKRLLDQAEAELRRLSHELCPMVLDDLGLVPALELLAAGVSKRTELRISIQSLNVKRLPAPLEVALYRVVQEALNNVSRHAKASSVRIRLHRSDEGLVCWIRDNGVGFNPDLLSQGRNGLGLRGMRERIQNLGGVFEIKSRKGRGTELHLTVPMENEHADRNSACR